jgi:hypothetical protein
MIAVIVGVLVAMAMLSGCSGGDSGSGGFGGAMGWVYTDGTTCIISGSSTPPPGYLPVADATVLVVGLPDLTTVTDANGRYLLAPIPVGPQTLQVGAPCGDLQYDVVIIAGQITVGGGHSEGGS